MKWGKLRVKTLAFEPADNGKGRDFAVFVSRKPVQVRAEADRKKLRLTLSKTVVLEGGQILECRQPSRFVKQDRRGFRRGWTG